MDHIALGSRLIAHCGTAAQREAHLPALLDGSRKATFAYLERGRRYALDAATTTATQSTTGWTLNGEKIVVMGAPLADCFVVSANTASGTGLFLVESKTPGVRINPYRTVDGQRAGDVVFSDVLLTTDAMLGTDGNSLQAIEEAIDFATALLCSEAVGAMKYACDATLEYLKTRKQFGAPIGAFQVLQHRMVDMYMAAEQSRSMAIMVACKVDAAAKNNDPANDEPIVNARKKAVSAARIFIADAAQLISQESVQLHGGMGMTEELKISHTFRRLTVLAQRFGDADHHLARYAACG